MDCRETGALPLTRLPEGGVSVNIVSTARGDVMVISTRCRLNEVVGYV